jgi:hypothetical protein
MRKILSRFRKDEQGQVLVLALALLGIGGLIVVPLLGFMGTGLMAAQIHEQKMGCLYAADAGIEDAAHKIMTDTSLPANVGGSVTYAITGVNDKNVTVTIIKESDALDFLENLTDRNFSGVHSDWMQVTDSMSAGTYTITVTDMNSNNKKLDSIGAWFAGTSYDIDGTASISGTHPPYSVPVPDVGIFEGGTSFIWSWAGPARPTFNVGDQMTLTFNYTPAEIPGLFVAFAAAGSADVGVVGGMLTFGVYKVTSVAADSTGAQTEIVSYITRMGVAPARPVILTWEVNP